MANTLINNKVLGEVIGAKLPGILRFAPLAKVDTTLKGTPGDTIKVEKYAYIGEAENVAPGAAIPKADLTMTSQEVKLKKAGKGFELLDEDVQVRGQEVIDEGKKQLEMSIKDKIDSDCYNVLKTGAKLKHNCTGKLNFEEIVKACSLFNDEEEVSKALYIHPLQQADIVLAPGFIPATQLGDDILKTGCIGQLGGCLIFKSIKVKKEGSNYKNIIYKDGALGIKLGKSVGIEDARDAEHQKTAYYGSEVYVAYVAKDDGVIVVTTNEEAMLSAESEAAK